MSLIPSHFRGLIVLSPLATVAARPAVAEQFDWVSPVFAPIPDWLANALTPGNILFCVVVTLCVAAGIIGVVTRKRRQRRVERYTKLNLRNGPRFRMIDAMCHATRKGRTINSVRLKRALEIARDATDKDYSLAQLEEVAQLTDTFIVPTNFYWMREGMTKDEKMVVFNSTASVLLADGPLTRNERAFLRSLTRGLGLDEGDLRHLTSMIEI